MDNIYNMEKSKDVFIEKVATFDDYSFSVEHDYINPSDELGYHAHSEFELQYVSKGCGVHVIGGITEPTKEGELILIPRNVPHAWFWDENTADSNGRIEEFTLKFDMSILSNKLSLFPELKSCERFFSNLKYAMEVEGESAQIIISKLRVINKKRRAERLISFLSILVEIAYSNNLKVISGTNNEWTINRCNNRLDIIYQYVLDNYTQNITIDEVAKVVAMNKSAFCNFFKRVTGKTFATMVNEYRINRAALMLYNDKLLTIKEISYSVGFGDPSYFNRVFHYYKGCSPMQYRKSNH